MLYGENCGELSLLKTERKTRIYMEGFGKIGYGCEMDGLDALVDDIVDVLTSCTPRSEEDLPIIDGDTLETS